MAKTFTLFWANIRKNRGQSVSLLIFVLIAVMLLDLGLVLYVDFGKFFDERAEQLRAPHAVTLQSADITTEEQKTYLEQYPGVVEVEKQGVIAGRADHYMNGVKSAAIILFANAAEPQTMNPLSLIGPSRPLDDDSIYIPYLMKAAGGYELGDGYRVSFAGTELDFTIAGFTEEISFGVLMNNLFRFYISEGIYARLSEQFADYKCFLQSVRMEESGLGTPLQIDYMKEFYYSQAADGISSTFIFLFSIDSVKAARTFIPMIMALVVAAVAIILLAVSLIVIRFRIINSIEEGMTNIGVLKAIGYKNGQIISSVVMQFGGVALLGGILGVGASQLLLPVLTRILESQSALIWNPGFNFGLSAVALVTVLLAVMLVSFIVAGRIRRLHPLVALRSGLQTHNFRKNNLPLDKTRGALPLLLAVKQLLQNKKQAVMITVIIAFVSFASISGLSIYYNVGIKPDAFVSVIVGEKPDAELVLKDRSDAEGLIVRLGERPDVRKAFGYQGISLLADENNVLSIIVKDCAQLEGGMLYEGRYPEHTNEVALGGRVSELTGKKTGDRVTIRQGSREKEFLVTGIIQLMENRGVNMLMTYDGLLTIQDEYEYDQIYIYLTENADVDAFIRSVKAVEGDIFSNTIDMRELIDAQFGSYADIFGAVASGILCVTMLVVVLVLYMAIKTMILRRRRELGIQKALGFTSAQLMNQVALYFTPIVLAGVALGGIGGYFGFNPLFAAFTRSAGIMRTELSSPLDWTIVTCFAVTALAYLVSMLVAWRIRRIAPHEMIIDIRGT